MENDKDFRIQEFLDRKMQGEQHVPHEKLDAEDVSAYEVLYKHLKKKPEQGLSLSFRLEVMRRIETEKKQADDTRFYLLLGFVFLVGVVVIASTFLVFKDALAPSFTDIGRYKGFILIGIVAVILYTIVEQRLNNAKIK